jgi:formylglycine-generating enzyme required for sulfatase activity
MGKNHYLKVYTIFVLASLSLLGFLTPTRARADSPIILTPGWNSVSFPKQPVNNRLDAVMTDISSNVSIILSYDNMSKTWAKWRPGDSSNSLLTLECGKGYRILINNAVAVLDPTGWSAPASSAVVVSDGWNLVGYSGTDGLDAASALANTSKSWNALWIPDQGQSETELEAIERKPASIPPVSTFFQNKAYWVRIGPGAGTVKWTPPSAPLPPSPPDQLIADGVQRSSGPTAALKWMGRPDALSYNVYYSTSSPVTKQNRVTVNSVNPSYNVTGLKLGTTYYFAVSTVTAAGESALSVETQVTPASPSPPRAPTLVVNAQNGQAQLLWSGTPAPSGYKISGYTIYYSSSPRVTRASTSIQAAGSPAVVSSLTNGTTYYFALSETATSNTNPNTKLESALSFEVSCSPTAFTLPTAPTGVTAVEGNKKITLSWSPVDSATSYNIYYLKNTGVSLSNGIKIANVTSPATIVGLENGTANKMGYFFVITAVNKAGESGGSSRVAATPVAAKPVQQMVLIPAGQFKMGDDVSGNLSYALPVHAVSVDAFYLDRYETTYEQWKDVYAWAVANGYSFNTVGVNGSYPDGIGTNMPVSTVSWYDVIKWLNARSQKEGRTPVYYTDSSRNVVYKTGRIDLENDMVDWSANGYRLPTEAEWEWAARGGTAARPYYWGDNLTPADANYHLGGAVTVGLYPPNRYGLYDMAGNLYEWVWDWGSATDGYRNWASWGSKNPRGPAMAELQATEKTRVRRSGSWAEGSVYSRVFERVFRVPSYTAPYKGFRSARNNQP